MNEESQDIDVFDKYHRGEMGVEEKADFEKKLRSDPMLQEQFDLYQTATQLIEGNAIRHEVGDILSKKKSSYPIWFSVAASLSVVTLVYVFLLRDGSQGLFESYFEAYPDVISTRSLEFGLEGLDFYKRGLFEEAEVNFAKTPNKSDTVYFYLAMSQLSQGDAHSAISSLNEIDSSSIFYPQKLWYSGLAKIGIGLEDEAVPFFRELRPTDFKYKASRSLMQKLGHSPTSPKEEK